jgi:hypothetical protein
MGICYYHRAHREMLATQVYPVVWGGERSLVGAYFVDNEVAVCLIAIPSLRGRVPAYTADCNATGYAEICDLHPDGIQRVTIGSYRTFGEIRCRTTPWLPGLLRR